jgi:hypothetical protein
MALTRMKNGAPRINLSAETLDASIGPTNRRAPADDAPTLPLTILYLPIR